MDRGTNRSARRCRVLPHLLLLFLFTACAGPTTWRARLQEELPRLGHRNWIVVADSAYPAQCSPGIETLATGEDHLALLRAVLQAVDRAPHVQARVFLDRELEAVAERDAPGIDACRNALDACLAGRPVTRLPHEEIIHRLDEAGRAFHVLVLKSTLTLPYTTVFLRLDCGYWNAAAEERLRRGVGE